MTSIEQIRASCSIAWAWKTLGLPGKPARECRSPFREDKRASLSIYSKAGWERWYDHGEATGGDVVDFWARAKEIPVKEAIADILKTVPILAQDCPVLAPNRPLQPPEPKSGIRWPPDIKEPSEADYARLSSLRNLSPEAFYLAGRLGTLKVATVYGAPAWIITDLSGICAEARRMDGAKYSDKKSFALPGSKKSWPVGLQTSNAGLNALHNIVLVEGGPDYFAALQLAIDSLVNFRPAAMLGASTSIGPEPEQYFRGSTVLILPHNDLGGEKSAERWALQARALGARKIVVQPLPFEHNDLNDFLVSSPTNPSQLLKGFESERTHPRT